MKSDKEIQRDTRRTNLYDIFEAYWRLSEVDREIFNLARDAYIKKTAKRKASDQINN